MGAPDIDAMHAAPSPPQSQGSQPLVRKPARYFTREEVDQPAEPLFKPPLLYPERAYLSGLSGKVQARVFINDRGGVDAVEIIDVSPPHQPFADSAMEVISRTVYAPARIGPLRVNSQRTVEVVFNVAEDSLR